MRRERFGEGFAAVLDAARAGEGWAFERLYSWLGGPVAAHLRHTGLEDPDGLTNEVFLRTFRGLGGFEGDEDRFRSWVFTIAHHLVVDERRRASRRPPAVALDDAGPDPGSPTASAAEAAIAGVGHATMLRTLERLAPAHRDVLLLRLVEDLSIEDTARILGKRPNAVKALQHRAVRALRALLAEEGVTA